MIAARRLEFLVEEPSMEAFLQELLPRLLPAGCSFDIRVFQGKHDLMRRLESRLRGYRNRLSDEFRLVVMVDRDQDAGKGRLCSIPGSRVLHRGWFGTLELIRSLWTYLLHNGLISTKIDQL